MNNSTPLIINSVTPLEKRPIHPKAAAARGLTENYEAVYVVKGFSLGGHIHAPLIFGDRYFKPFTKHVDPNAEPHLVTVQVLLNDPANPFEGGDIAKYHGLIKNYENVIGVKRPTSSAPQKNKKDKPQWILKTLILTIYDSFTKAKTNQTITDVIGWRSGGVASIQTIPFSVKAVELTSKEIEAHKVHNKQHARIPL